MKGDLGKANQQTFHSYYAGLSAAAANRTEDQFTQTPMVQYMLKEGMIDSAADAKDIYRSMGKKNKAGELFISPATAGHIARVNMNYYYDNGSWDWKQWQSDAYDNPLLKAYFKTFKKLNPEVFSNYDKGWATDGAFDQSDIDDMVGGRLRAGLIAEK